MPSPRMLDRDWVRNSFLVSQDKMLESIARTRYFTTASLKYVDTSPGANIMINPPPQFTRLADIKPPSIRDPNSKAQIARMPGHGMYANFNTENTLGRYYSEAIDDNAHLIYIRAGKTAYNSITNFLGGYYSYYAGVVARTGRTPSFMYSVGKLANVVWLFAGWPIFLLILGIKTIGVALDLAKLGADIPKSKYAYLKPTMHLYWASVQSMVNRIAADMGIIDYSHANRKLAADTAVRDAEARKAKKPEYAGSSNFIGNASDKNAYLTNEQLKAWSRALPDIINEDGEINVYAWATKGAKLANAHRKAAQRALDNPSINYDKAVTQLWAFKFNVSTTPPLSKRIVDFITGSSWNAWDEVEAKAASIGETDDIRTLNKIQTGNKMQMQQQEAEDADGSAWVCFRVEEGGGIGESFSNSATDSGMKSTMDSASSGFRQTFASWAGMNIGDSFISNTMESIVGGVVDFFGGVADTFGFGGILGVTGGGFVDIPQHWDSSSTSMPRGNYTIKLHSPYTDPLSRLIHEIVPTCMLLALALPHSTGPQSYGSPFMVQFFDKGRTQCRYGMVDSISIQRGTLSTPFTQDRAWRGVEINLSILDLTSVVHMPLSESLNSEGLVTMSGALQRATSELSTVTERVTGVAPSSSGDAGSSATSSIFTDIMGWINKLINLGDAYDTLFSDDTLYSDYMSTLASLGLMDAIYAGRKLDRRWKYIKAEWNTAFSMPSVTMAYSNHWMNMPMRILARNGDMTSAQGNRLRGEESIGAVRR